MQQQVVEDPLKYSNPSKRAMNRRPSPDDKSQKPRVKFEQDDMPDKQEQNANL